MSGLVAYALRRLAYLGLVLLGVSLIVFLLLRGMPGVDPLAAYIAPGGHHLALTRRGTGYVLRVTDGPPVNRHRPSVDTLFRSIARTAGARGAAPLFRPRWAIASVPASRCPGA